MDVGFCQTAVLRNRFKLVSIPVMCFHRLPNDRFILLLLLLYSPVGLCLMLLRIFIGVHVFLVSCALPDSIVRRFIVRIMCSVLGLHVRQNSPRLRDKTARLYICNHVTHFDHNMINLLTSCNTLLATELGVISTQITKADKAEHIKRKRHIASQTALSSKNGFNVQTNCVDTTITNLLEHTDHFNSEAAVSTPSAPAKPAASSTPSVMASTPNLKSEMSIQYKLDSTVGNTRMHPIIDTAD
ncbi:Ancient ubiquitous protein 1 [Anabarilius grahami]|uniref:Ancient ubiquitous protein 1 n=1 Tax=Anabarilius grahami TaxID=495550 RepID=A0A3N0XJ77_ANAGA|nr:Ancient ubiquitous protein 1 [Anabarilius grahami]